MSTETGRRGSASCGGAFAGVFDPRRTESGERLRGRLAKAIGPDGLSRGSGDGCLSLAWTEGIVCNEPREEGILSLLDGRLYNRSDLAKELGLPEETGAAALLTSGYAALGVELLPRLRGDFTLVLWDPVTRTGLIARDQLGGRGLFIHRFSHGIAFASEVRNLTRLLPRKPQPDPVGVAHWLVLDAIPEGRTLFEGVEPLPPATCLTFGDGAVATDHYWTPRYRRRTGLSPEHASAEVRASLRQAVERRAGSRASTAVLLSGGIDSASVAGVAASALTDGVRPNRSYSAIFPGYPEIDESALIGLIAAHTGLRSTGLRFESGELLSGALPFLESWELPPTTPTLFFLYPLLQRAASDGVRVLLDGEGGDAVFWHPAELLAERLRRGRFLSVWSLAGRFPEYGTRTTWRTRLNRLRQWGRYREFRPTMPDWLVAKPSDLTDSMAPAPSQDGPVWWAARVEGILGPGSRMVHDTSRRHAALSGIEPRHPLLDVDLIELVLSLPPELAFDRRYNRPVLRHAVRGLIPEEARLRPYKSNFDPVVSDGLNADLPVIEKLLLAPGAEVAAYTRRSRLEAHLASPPSGTGALREWGTSIWHLATLECWLRQQAGRDLLPAGLMKRLELPNYGFVSL